MGEVDVLKTVSILVVLIGIIATIAGKKEVPKELLLLWQVAYMMNILS